MKNFGQNYWVRSGFFTISQRLSGPLFGIGSFLILVRSLSPEEMGTWSLFLSMSTTLEVARNGLLKGATVKFYGESADDQKTAITSSGFIINLGYTLLVSALILVLASFISGSVNAPNLKNMLYLFGGTSLLMIPFSHFEYIQQSEMKFQGVFLSYFTKQGVLFLLILISLMNWYELAPFTLVIFQAIGVLLGAAVSWLFVKNFLSRRLITDKSWIKKFWGFGKFGLLTNVGASITTTADHYLIGGLINPRAVGIYNVAVRTTNIFTIPSVAIADILYPKTVRSHAARDMDAVRRLYENAVGATLVAMIPAMIIVLVIPAFIIQVIAGPEYMEAAHVLRISIISILIKPFLTQFGTIVNTLGRPKINFIFVSTLSVINIILNFFFIREWGILGAAYANLTGLAVGLAVSQYILFKTVNIRTTQVLKCTLKYYGMIIKIILNKIK